MSGEKLAGGFFSLLALLGGAWAFPFGTGPAAEDGAQHDRGIVSTLSLDRGQLLLHCNDSMLPLAPGLAGEETCRLEVRPAAFRIIGSPSRPGDVPVML